jgi:integrase
MSKGNGFSRYLFKKGETFYARVAIPKALRGFYGKDIILRSLGTGDIKLAEHRKDIAVGEIKREFERLSNLSPFEMVSAVAGMRWEASLSGDGATMTPTDGGALALGALAVEAMATDDPVRKTEIEQRKRALLEAERARVSEWRDDLAARRGRFALPPIVAANPEAVRGWIREANALLEFLEGGLGAKPMASLHEIAAAVSGGELSEVARAQIAHEIPAALLPPRARPYLAQARSTAVPDDDNITLADLVRRFFADEKRACLDPATRRNYTVTVEIMKEILGDNTPVRAIRRDDLRRVQQVIRHLPARAKDIERFQGMTYAQIAEVAKAAREAGEVLPALKSGTRNKYIRNLGTIFQYAEDERKIDANPALGLTIHLPEDKDEDGKEPFTDNDLRAMFPRTYRLEGLNWLPLLMLFHGLRPTEAAQLDTDDVIQVDGLWAFDISDETKGATGAARRGDKSLKNDRSTPRRVPIHQRILELSFLAYLDTRKAAGERKLFAVKRYGDAGHFESIRHEFTDWLKAVGVKRPTTGPHSFRHNWGTASFRVVEDPLRKIMGGWTLGKGVDVQDYLHTHRLSLADMKAELDKVTFDVLTAEEDPARSHPGLIAAPRERRGKPETAEAKRPRKRHLVPGKERG